MREILFLAVLIGRGAKVSALLIVALAAAMLLGPSSAWAGSSPADDGPIPPSPNWKNTVQYPDDPFAVTESYQASWIKFTILVSDPTIVYFQDSNVYPFHYDFVTSEMPPFEGLGHEEFEAIALYEEGQQLILGAVLFPPLESVDFYPEYGIQLIRGDPYSVQEVVDLFHLVESKVLAEPQIQALYFPTFEQLPTALANEALLESQGVSLGSPARWADGNLCPSHGWALGELKFFASDAIDAAFLAGDLTSDDILLTDALPAGIPMVAGVLSLSPVTPNSHVVILADTFDVPLVHLALERDAQRAQDLVGHKIGLRTGVPWTGSGCEVKLIDVEGILDPATIDEILVLKEPPPLQYRPMRPYGAYSASTDGLVPNDIHYFGGKAANFGILRRAIPSNSPVATAFSFDLWNAFMDQDLGNGNTLREEIDLRLGGFSFPPADMAQLAQALDDVQEMIKDDGVTSFSAELETAVIVTLQDPQYAFDPDRKIRFRSSTNVEDSEHFTGAGLYDSYSGCLDDDLDSDTLGPSLCNPDEPKEKGVFRAIRKVFASFYNVNAFLERLRFEIDESTVGMGLLVHHSFPDEIELANGVVILTGHGFGSWGSYVSQVGAVSVTNPEPGTIPEEIIYSPQGTTGPVFDVVTYSNLLPIGETVLEAPAEYEQLRVLLDAVQTQYITDTGGVAHVLEFEYKLVAPLEQLIVKQVRTIPEPDDVPSITPFLVNEPTEHCVRQDEFVNIYGLHRLKSRWTFETQSDWLTESLLQDGFLGNVHADYTEGCQHFEQNGLITTWPEATYSFADGDATLTWVFDHLQNSRTHTLRINDIPELVAPSQGPLLVLSDFAHIMVLEVEYETPVPVWNSAPTTTEFAALWVCPLELPEDQIRQGTVTDGGVTVNTTYHWPPLGNQGNPKTEPLARFDETTVEGLTSEPLVFRDYFSQTYRPGHHHSPGDYFMLEPALEPGLSPQQRDELEAAGIRMIQFFDDLRYPELDWIAYVDDSTWGDTCVSCTGDDADDDGWCVDGPTSDCDDTNPDVWTTPGEVRDLRFTTPDTLEWTGPLGPGGTVLVYDTLRSAARDDFQAGGECIEIDDGPDTVASAVAIPSTGNVHHYLVRAENDCPLGEGPLGTGSDQVQREGRSCP